VNDSLEIITYNSSFSTIFCPNGAEELVGRSVDWLVDKEAGQSIRTQIERLRNTQTSTNQLPIDRIFICDRFDTMRYASRSAISVVTASNGQNLFLLASTFALDSSAADESDESIE
jgi:hypothetical protein